MTLEKDYQMSGTNPVSDITLTEENVLIAIEDIRMFDGAIFYASPHRKIMFPESSTDEPSLAVEFEAWDELSDEALANFEAMLN